MHRQAEGEGDLETSSEKSHGCKCQSLWAAELGLAS